MTKPLRTGSRWLAFVVASLLPLAAWAGAGPKQAQVIGRRSVRPAGDRQVQRSVKGYLAKRGFRPGVFKSKTTGLSRSGESTRVTLRIGVRDVDVTINNTTGVMRPNSAGALLDALAAVHTPQRRSGRTAGTRFAVKVLSFRPGGGAGFNAGAWRAGGSGAPLGRPRGGQTVDAVALDAVSLGRRGSIELRLGTSVVNDGKGAGIRVRENGLTNAGGAIINQTPGLVEVSDGARWYRLGHAGYKGAGDVLALGSAIDRIPPGARITSVRVTDDPSGPRTQPADSTDNVVAGLGGKTGFDLVSVEAVPGR